MRGPKTVPYGTPDITDVALDDSPSTITLWCLSVNQEEIQ